MTADPLRRNPRTSVRTRVALSIGLVTIAAALILALTAGRLARTQIEEAQGEALLAGARRIMESLDQGMFERFREIQLVSALSDIRDPKVPQEQKRALLERIQRTHGHHAWIGIAAPDGIAQVGTQGYLEGRDVSKRPWFRNGLAAPYVGDVHDALLLAKLLPNPAGDDIYLLDVAAPVLGPDNKPVGVICSHLHWRWTGAVLKALAIESGAEVFLVSREGLVLHGPGFRMHDRFEGSAPAVEAALRESVEGHYLAPWGSDTAYLTAHATSRGLADYPGLGWRLILRQESSVAFAAAAALETRILALGLLLGGVFALIGWVVAGRLTRPIEAIAAEAERIRNGDLSRELPRFGGRDEIAHLSDALALMLGSLKREIESRRQAEEKVRLAATVFENSTEGILITDPENRILSVNSAFCAITGYWPEEVLGRNPKLLASGRHGPQFYEAMWREIRGRGYWQGEIWNRRKNGEIFPEWLVITAVKDDGERLSHYVAVFSDITERKRAEERIRFLANHDPLTELPNRYLLNDRFQHAIGRAQRLGSGLALIFIDLDRFKDINDTLGHPVGDELLKAVATRLEACLRPGDTLARQGGDEFVVLVEDIREVAQVAPIIEGMLEAFFEPFLAGGHAMSVTPSIGIALYPEDGTDIEALVRYADIAMYRAKEVGRNNYQFYTPALNARVVDRLDLESRLKRALDEGQFTVHYQPQVEVASGRIVGAEALLRWHDPERGSVPPGRFIPLAEETGLIIPIGDFVLRTACAQAARWAGAGIPVRIAINLSARQLRRRDLGGYVGHMLEEFDLKPALIEIELTESVIMAASESERVNLEQLERLGVELSLDDFGTGYSSLSYLHRLQVSTLKIDRSFIAELSDPDGASLTETIIRMAKSLGLKLVAEGVETAEQLDFIARHEVDFYQGFYFARPMPAEEFEALLRKEGGGRSASPPSAAG